MIKKEIDDLIIKYELQFEGYHPTSQYWGGVVRQVIRNIIDDLKILKKELDK